jgi:hypothetical protein
LNTIRARSAFEKSLDIDYARDGEVMIAFAMNEPDEIEIAIQAALSLPRPALVEAVVDAETRPNRKRYGHSPRAGHFGRASRTHSRHVAQVGPTGLSVVFTNIQCGDVNVSPRPPGFGGRL